MITKNQSKDFCSLVNEIVTFSNSFANEQSPLFKYLHTSGMVYGVSDLNKVVHSNILSDILHCYFALGYQRDYNNGDYLLFDCVQYAFWFEKENFSYEDFTKYKSSQSNINYFLKGFNNSKREMDSVLFPALYMSLIKVDPLKGAVYVLILEKIVTTLSENLDEEIIPKEELIIDLLTDLESLLVSKDFNNENFQIDDNRKFNMVNNQEEYEKAYLLVRKIVRFVNLFTNKADCNSELSNYLKNKGCSFSNLTLKDYVQLIIGNDILNCYFLLGYQQIYKKETYLLLDMIEYGFHIQDVPWSYDEFKKLYIQYSDYFCKVFDIGKNAIKSNEFPALYIYLSEVNDNRADEYVRLLQEITNVLSSNQDDISNEKDPRIDVLLTYPQAFLHSEDGNNESPQIEDNRDIQQIEEESIDNTIDKNSPNVNLLKDKLFNGISLEIIREEYKEGALSPFRVILRVSNYNDSKKKIRVDMKYISTKHGIKDGCCVTSGVSLSGVFIPDNTFIDMEFVFDEITNAYNGDRIEMEINEGKYASLKLLRERGQWTIIESIERSTYNRELKNKIEQFEAIEEQLGITLQNFSVKVEDENSMNVFCEVLALNGEIPKNDFTINIAIYDNNNDIVYTDSESKYAEDFKGFEVLTFYRIRLDITVDEISKIRIYPTR